MKLRSKITFITLLFLVVVILLLYPITSLFMLRTFEEFEKDGAVEDILMIKEQVIGQVRSLSENSILLSSNDQTMDFIDEPTEEFISTNLVLQHFRSLETNIVLILDRSGRVVFERSYDLLLDIEIDVPVGLTGAIQSDTTMWTYSDVRDEHSGFLEVGQNVFMFSSRPVLRSNNQGPISGSLLVLKFFGRDNLLNVPVRENMVLDYHKVSDPYTPNDYGKVIAELEHEEAVVLTMGDRIAGYSGIMDHKGDMVLMLKATMNRDVSQKGFNSILYYFLLTSFVFILGVVFIAIIVERTVIRRLTLLNSDVERISPQGVINERTDVKGSDEIGNLGRSINSMLDSMEMKQAELLMSEEKYRKLVKSSPTGICILRDGRIIFINETGGRILGLIDPGSIIGRDISEFLPGNRKRSVEEVALRLDRDGSVPLREIEVIRPDGKMLQMQIMATRMSYMGDESVMVNFMDITELQKARKELFDRELRYRTLYELSTDSIMLLKDGMIISCNNATLEIAGRPMS